MNMRNNGPKFFDNDLELKVKRLTETAILPTKNYRTDAAFDLYADEDCILKQGKQAIIKTGICMEIPEGYAGLIWPRSGMSAKSGIDVLAGVVDSDYRGEVKVCLLFNDLVELSYDPFSLQHNVTHKEYEVKRGDKIAQMVIQQIPNFYIKEVSELNDSDRGELGFGSSGK